MDNVLFSILGRKLDAGPLSDKRWQRWRPNVAMAMQSGLPLKRIELVYHDEERHLATSICRDIAAVSPDTQPARRAGRVGSGRV